MKFFWILSVADSNWASKNQMSIMPKVQENKLVSMHFSTTQWISLVVKPNFDFWSRTILFNMIDI